MRKIALVAATAMLTLAFAAPGRAEQPVADSFQQLRLIVRLGDTVTVTDASGNRVTGRVSDLSSSSLALLSGANQHNLAERDVVTISRRRHADLATGAKWGFGVGAGFGALVMLAVSGANGDCRGCAAWIPLVSAVYGGIGTGVGVGISAAIQTNHVIFKRPAASSARISVGPLVTQNRKGMVATIGF